MNRRDFLKRAAAVSCAVACGDAIAPIASRKLSVTLPAAIGIDIPTGILDPKEFADVIAMVIRSFQTKALLELGNDLRVYEMTVLDR